MLVASFLLQQARNCAAATSESKLYEIYTCNLCHSTKPMTQINQTRLDILQLLSRKANLFSLASVFLAELDKASTDGEDAFACLGISWLFVLASAGREAAACLGLLVGPGLLGRMFFSMSSSLSTSSVGSAVKLQLEPVVLSSCRYAVVSA